MVSFIQPLELQTWFMSVLSGTPEIFTVISLFAITSLGGYFRMSGITLFFMIGIFLIMFSGFINSPLLILLVIMGGLLIGFVLARTFNN